MLEYLIYKTAAEALAEEGTNEIKIQSTTYASKFNQRGFPVGGGGRLAAFTKTSA